jgi:PncC family amidohydrolase
MAIPLQMRKVLNSMNQSALNSISRVLIERRETVAVAESVTAGLITSMLSRALNATKFLQGGIIVYNLGQKTKHLNVDPISADEVNCVSPEVANQMAAEAGRQFCSHWGIAITGYAAPVPALNIRACFAYYSICKGGETVVSDVLQTNLRGQARVQQYFVDQLLLVFLRHLKLQQ